MAKRDRRTGYADCLVAAHREMIRKGYAYVALSAQAASNQIWTRSKRRAAASRFRTRHATPVCRIRPTPIPDDIFSQAGMAVRCAKANGLLGGLVARRIIAAGESQSAIFLTTYLNAIDPDREGLMTDLAASHASAALRPSTA
jgi:hypothetical protein